MAEQPTPPGVSRLIGSVYEIGPDGVWISQRVPLTISYDRTWLPTGAEEKDLVLAEWDNSAGTWEELQTTVDNVTSTLSATIGHFGVYGVLAHTRPASFTTSGLTVDPVEVDWGGPVKISVTIQNNGDLTGVQKVTLLINGAAEASQDVSVNGGDNETATFSVVKKFAGSYSVDVSGMTSSFRVRQPPPAALPTFKTEGLSISPLIVPPGHSVTVSFMVTNTGQSADTYRANLTINNALLETKDVFLEAGAHETVVFAVVKTNPGVYGLEAGSLFGSFEVTPPAAPGPRMNWWLVGGGIAVMVALAVFLSITVKRQAV